MVVVIDNSRHRNIRWNINEDLRLEIRHTNAWWYVERHTYDVMIVLSNKQHFVFMELLGMENELW